MNSLFLVALYGALCYATANSNKDKIETLMDNVVVLRVPHGVGTQMYIPLTCGEAYQHQSVFWKKDGMELKPALQGNQVKVLVEEMDGGNYTCHLSTDGQYLNHTVILVQLDPDNRTVILKEKSPEEGHIHCSAHNYTGSFHCSWTRTSFRSNAAVLLVKAERNWEKIPCELDADGSGVHCQDDNCPYKEEQHRIILTVYIHSYSRLEAYTKAFFLREIVRPGELSNLHSSDGKVFSWSYPDSWEKPCTFFGLHFQVKVVHHGFTCDSREHRLVITNFEVKIKTKKYVFCARAQDKYTSGPFGPWSSCM
uniref:Interleukin-12 subunit beta n=1 Tax=Mola mola TaxID=94237 RepID=A0A3Q4B8M3_MOLML